MYCILLLTYFVYIFPLYSLLTYLPAYIFDYRKRKYVNKFEFIRIYMLILRIHKYIVELLQFTQMPKLGHKIKLFLDNFFVLFYNFLKYLNSN